MYSLVRNRRSIMDKKDTSCNWCLFFVFVYCLDAKVLNNFDILMYKTNFKVLMTLYHTYLFSVRILWYVANNKPVISIIEML